MKNLQLIQAKINSIKPSTKFIKQAKAKRIEYYLDHASELDALPLYVINKHDFLSEILEAAMNIEKLEYFEKHKYKLIGALERHAYAPELNTMYFRNHTTEIKVPRCNTIEQAIKYIITNQTLEQIKSI